MTSAEEKLDALTGASLDAALRDLDRRIATIELAEIPPPGSGPEHSPEQPQLLGR
jgi:hypothetical protein